MTNDEINDALWTATDLVFEVAAELKRRGWDTKDLRRLPRDIDRQREMLKRFLAREADWWKNEEKKP